MIGNRTPFDSPFGNRSFEQLNHAHYVAVRHGNNSNLGALQHLPHAGVHGRSEQLRIVQLAVSLLTELGELLQRQQRGMDWDVVAVGFIG